MSSMVSGLGLIVVFVVSTVGWAQGLGSPEARVPARRGAPLGKIIVEPLRGQTVDLIAATRREGDGLRVAVSSAQPPFVSSVSIS